MRNKLSCKKVPRGNNEQLSVGKVFFDILYTDLSNFYLVKLNSRFFYLFLQGMYYVSMKYINIYFIIYININIFIY